MRVTTPTFQVVRQRDEVAASRDDGSDAEQFVIEESLDYLVNFLGRSFARSLARRLARHGVPSGQ